MNLTALTSPALIDLKTTFSSRDETIEALAEKLNQQGKLNNKDEYLKAVYAREAHTSTVIDDGLAIPHGKTNAVKEGAFAMATLKTPVKWPTDEGEDDIRLIFLLAIPDAEAGSTHLQLLAHLATTLADDDVRKAIESANTPEDVIRLLNGEGVETTSTAAAPSTTDSKNLLAITACTAGVAHTYMAAQFLEKEALARGYNIKVEKQGANGIEDRITAEDVANADGIIYATDVGVAEQERFEGLPNVHCKVAYAIKHADEMIDKLEGEATGYERGSTNTSNFADSTTGGAEGGNVVTNFFKDWYGGALSGVSHIIPLVIIGGLVVGLLNLFFGYDYTHLYNEGLLQAAGSSLEQLGIGAGGLEPGSKDAIKAISDVTVPYAQSNPEFATSLQGIVHYLYYIALKAFNPLLVCVLAAFTAYGMVGKPGLAPGFVGGYVAMGGTFGKLSVVSGGFIGGLVAGAAAALFVMLLRQVKVPAVLESVKTLILIPLVAGVLTILFMLIGPGKFFAFLNNELGLFLESLKGSNLLLLGFILGCMSNFDMGGPINKAAYLFCIGMGVNGQTEFYAAFTAAKCIPGMSLGIMSTVFRRLFDKEDQAAGVSTAILGFCGITEGAIPYAVKDPIRVIPFQMIGGGVAAGLILYSGIEIGTVAGGAVFMLPVISQPLLWLAYFGIGVATAIVGTVLLKTFWKKGDLASDLGVKA